MPYKDGHSHGKHPVNNFCSKLGVLCKQLPPPHTLRNDFTAQEMVSNLPCEDGVGEAVPAGGPQVRRMRMALRDGWMVSSRDREWTCLVKGQGTWRPSPG